MKKQIPIFTGGGGCPTRYSSWHRFFVKAVLIPVLFFAVLGSVACLPAWATNTGERADWEVIWSHITTWPYGSEHFSAAERFKGGDPRVVFVGTSRHVAIYNFATNTWQAIGYWPHNYKIHDVTVRDGNTSIVFVGEYGRYAVLEFVSGSWRWVAAGIWPAGDRYKYYGDWYSIDIWTVCDRHGSDNTVVMGGDGGCYALLSPTNTFLTNANACWAYSGPYNRAMIRDAIPYSDGRIRLVGRQGGNWLGLAAQWLNANNTLGASEGQSLSGIVRGAKKGTSSYWWLSENAILGADTASSSGARMYVGFTGPMQEWSNGTLFIGEYSGNKRYKVWRYDGTFGKEGVAPVNIGWVEAQPDGSVLIAGDGKVYRGVSQPAPNVEQPELVAHPPLQVPQATVYGSPFGKWDLSSPVQQTLYSWTVPNGGTMRSLTLQYSMFNASSGGSVNDDGTCRVRIRGYKAGTGPGGVQEVLVVEVAHHLSEQKSASGAVAVLFPQGVTFFRVTCEPDEIGGIDENPRFVVDVTLKDIQYYVYRPNDLKVRWDNGYVLAWQIPAYPSGTSLEYAVMKNGSQISGWSSNVSFTDTEAKGDGSEKYSVLCRHRGASTYKEVPVPEEMLQTAWNTATIKEIKNAVGGCWILKVSGANGATCTRSDSFAVTVTAVGAVEFRARAGAGPWSEWVPIGSPALVTGLTETGVYTIYVEARNSSGVTAVSQMTVFRI